MSTVDLPAPPPGGGLPSSSEASALPARPGCWRPEMTTPYEVGTAYIDGNPIGKVTAAPALVDEPGYASLPRTIIERALASGNFDAVGITFWEEGFEVIHTDHPEENSTTITIRPRHSAAA